MIGALLLKWEMRRSFDAMSRKDLAAMMRGWAKDSVFEFPGKTPVSGRHEGKPAIEAFFRTVFARMVTMRFTVKRIAVTHPLALGFTNTVLVEWTAEETSREGVTAHVQGFTVAEFRRGKGIAGRDYIFDVRQLEALWATTESTPHMAIPVTP